MAIRKENDWVGVNLSNPDFTNTDFKDVGINIDNTSIGPESAYISNPQIRQMEEFQSNGKFDQAKFHQKYVELAASYNDLAKDTYSRDLKGKGRIFAENDIFVSPEERRQNSGAFMTLVNNPDHITYGIVGVDQPGPRTKTPMELAEGHPIFDSNTGKFTEDTPEDSFFKYFWRPKMMATWDFNADINGNPTDDPSKIAHLKGEYKLTEDGEYYTEFVNGRSTYGKEVVSHWNILTKEDSWINKYDPFDSDDIKKSTAGSIARNALKILPLLPFAPLTAIAPYYAMASIGINLVDALGTLGKLVVGSENTTLNNITAFAEQFNQTISEEGMQHTFGMESVLNMVGDTFMFLQSQRILAEQAPKLFMSEAAKMVKNPEASMQELYGGYVSNEVAKVEAKYAALKGTIVDQAKLSQEMSEEIQNIQHIGQIRAQAIMNNQINNFHKLGRQISTGMMAVTFGLHTYGTAKAQDVSDEAATALTLGAIAGQYLLLTSHLGQKIFPEAGLQKQQVKKALEEWYAGTQKGGYKAVIEEFNAAQSVEAKEKATQSMFKKGYDLAKQIWDVQESIGGTIAASTAATAIEMTAFTALDDVIASVYNLASWISGNDDRMMAWHDIEGRYGSALLGGAIAGAMNARDIYRNAQAIRNMDQPKALDLIIYMINEGKENELIKEIDKHTWGNPYLSTNEVATRNLTGEEYQKLYGTGTREDNQDQEIKNVMKNAIYDMKQILTQYGAKISENSLLDVLINGRNITKDLRLAALKNSTYAKAFLEDYIHVQRNIYQNAKALSSTPQDQKANGVTDATKRQTEKELSKLDKLRDAPAELDKEVKKLSPQATVENSVRNDLMENLTKNEEYLNGKRRVEFVKKALFEMLHGINSPYIDMAFYQYATEKAQLPMHKISQGQLIQYAKDFYYTSDRATKIEHLNKAFEIFEKTNNLASTHLKEIKELIENKDLTEFLQMLEPARIATRNQLFGIASPDQRPINPYEDKEYSPYESNKAERPEDIIQRINFAGYATHKKTYDNLFFMLKILERYEGQREDFKAIRSLITLFDDLQLYKRFLIRYKEKVEQSEKAFEEWKKKRDEFFAKPENEGAQFEIFQNELGESRPLEYTASDIGQLITKEYLTSKGREDFVEGEKEETAKNQKKPLTPEERIFTLFNKLNEFLNANQGVISTEVGTASSIRAELMDYDKLLKGNTQFETTLIDYIETGIYTRLGGKFVAELYDLLQKGGYLTDYQKEHLIQMIDSFAASGELLDRAEVLIDSKIMDTLSSITGGEEYAQMARLVQDLSQNDQWYEFLSQWKIAPDEFKKYIENYNTNGVLSVADKLLQTFTNNPNKSVSGIIQAINGQVESTTSPFVGFMTDMETRTKEFLLSPELISDINDAVLVLQLLRSSYAAATEEVNSVFNHVGYNATVNKIQKESGLKLPEDKELVTLSSQQVQQGIDSIQDSIYKLLYWKEVASNAMHLRTEETDKADLAFRLNVMQQIEEKIAKLDSSIWAGKADFSLAVSKLETYIGLKEQEVGKRLEGHDNETFEKVTKELISFELALYKFFQANKDNLSDINKLSTFINKTNFKYTSSIDAIKNQDKLADDHAMIWYLASIAALDPEVFYSNLKESLHSNRLPVALQTMWKYTVSSFLADRKMFNNFRLAYLESIKADYPDLYSDDATKKEEAEKKFAREYLSYQKHTRYEMMLLVSSGPGFGKSTYIPELLQVIKSIFPEINLESELWISGPEMKGSVVDAMAIKMRESAGLKETPTFTRDTLMKKILKDFDKYEETFKVTDGKLQGKTADGEEQTFNLNLKTGNIDFDFELNEGLDTFPKIIIIDEISDFSQFDIDVIEAFAKKNNIIVLTHGDFTQSGIYGSIKLNEGDGNVTDCALGLTDTQFMRTFKSQMSYRSANSQTDLNNAQLRKWVEDYLAFLHNDGKLVEPELKMSYYVEQKNGKHNNLYGTFVEHRSNEGLSNQCKSYIDGIYRSLADGEKVILLYTDEESLFYKYVTQEHPEYEDKTEFRKGSTVKSTENKYYLIDLNNKKFSTTEVKLDEVDEVERIIREYYTALTRQKQGSIVMDNLSGYMPGGLHMVNKPMDSNTQEIQLPPKFIEDRASKFAQILTEMFPTKKGLKGSSTEQKQTNKLTPSKEQGGGAELDPTSNDFELDAGDTDDPAQAGDLLGKQGFSDMATKESRTIEEKHPLEIKTVAEKSKQIFNLKRPNGLPDLPIINEYINYVLNTFNALRTGLTKDGMYSLKTNIQDRRDCIYGLRYIDSLLRKSGVGNLNIDFAQPLNGKISDAEENKVIEMICAIQSLVRTRDNSEIKDKLYSMLKASAYCPKDDFDFRYVVATYYDGLSKRIPMLDVDREQETGWGAKGYGDRNNEVNRKELLLVIGKNGHGVQDDEIYLTIPVATFPNYMTVFNKSRDAFDPIVQKLVDAEVAKGLKGNDLDSAIYKKLEELIINSNTNNQPIPKGASTLMKLVDFYLHTAQALFYLHEDMQMAKTPSHKNGYYEHLGWFISASDRGFDYLVEGFEHEAKNKATERYTLHEVESLYQEPDKDVSAIFTFKSGTKSASWKVNGVENGITFYSGAQYVLMADRKEFLTVTKQFDEAAMIDYFNRQLADPTLPIKVKVQAVRPPEATFDQFIESERVNLFTKADELADTRQDIGNQFTIYRILQKLFAEHYRLEKAGQDSPIVQACNSIMTTRFDNEFGLATIGREILEMSYIEGQLSEARKEKIKDIYDLAESELRDEEKAKLRTWITTNNYKSYVQAISARMKTRIIKQDNTQGIQYRTKYRRFLQLIYEPANISSKEQFASINYDKAVVQKFIRDAASTQALLYNPEFEKTESYKLRMPIGESAFAEFTLHKVKTDAITNSNNQSKGQYKGLDFVYASNIFSGPFVGNIMGVIDQVLQKTRFRGNVYGGDEYKMFFPDRSKGYVAEIFGKLKNQAKTITHVSSLSAQQKIKTISDIFNNYQSNGFRLVEVTKNKTYYAIADEDLPNQGRNRVNIFRHQNIEENKKKYNFGQVNADTFVAEIEFNDGTNSEIKYYKLQTNPNGTLSFIDITAPKEVNHLNDNFINHQEVRIEGHYGYNIIKSVSETNPDVVQYIITEPNIPEHYMRVIYDKGVPKFYDKEGNEFAKKGKMPEFIKELRGFAGEYVEIYDDTDNNYAIFRLIDGTIEIQIEQEQDMPMLGFEGSIGSIFIKDGKMHMSVYRKINTDGEPEYESETIEGDQALKLARKYITAEEGYSEAEKYLSVLNYTDPQEAQSNKQFDLTLGKRKAIKSTIENAIGGAKNITSATVPEMLDLIIKGQGKTAVEAKTKLLTIATMIKDNELIEELNKIQVC